MVNGQVRVCFLDAEEGKPQQALVLFVAEDGSVLFQSDLMEVQPGWCIGFGPVCAKCDLEATASYEAGEPPAPSKGKSAEPAAKAGGWSQGMSGKGAHKK